MLLLSEAKEGMEPPVLQVSLGQSQAANRAAWWPVLLPGGCPSRQQLCSPAGGSAGNPSHAKGPEGREMQVTAGTARGAVPRYLGYDSN